MMNGLCDVSGRFNRAVDLMTRRGRWFCLSACLLPGLFAAPVSAADVVTTSAAEIEISVPNPADPDSTMKVVLGELVGRLGADRVQQRTVIGFHKTYRGELCCESIHFLNLVVSDPNPPGWKDSDGKVHAIAKGSIYVDPLSGGNMPPGQQAPNPVADRLPWYDGERARRKASSTGDFLDGEKKEYDLNDVKISDAFDWTRDPLLDMVFADGPTLSPGLEFITLLVCANGKVLCPLGGIAWGLTDKSVSHIDAVFEGSDLPAGLSTDAVTAALARSGFADYRMKGTPCCAAPEPATVALSFLGLAALGQSRRRTVRHRSAAVPA